MLAELNAVIAILRQTAEETHSKPIAEFVQELRQARQTAKAFLLDGQALTTKTLFGERVNGYLGRKQILIPKDDPKQSPNIYLVTVTAEFPSPVARNRCVEALDRVEYKITIAGDQYAEATSVLYPVRAVYSYYLKDLVRINLAAAAEVIALIDHDLA